MFTNKIDNVEKANRIGTKDRSDKISRWKQRDKKMKIEKRA